jgi:hypothetical protein
MELDRERGNQPIRQATRPWFLAVGTSRQAAARAAQQARTAEARAQRSTQHAGNDWRWPMPNSRLIKEGRKLGNYLHTKAASSAKGQK